MIDNWNDYCATKIEKGKTIPMDAALLAHVETFDFTCVDRQSLDDILADPAANPALAAMFGADPGSPPPGTVPPMVEVHELRYVDALMGAYGERDKCTYACHEDITANAVHSQHFFEQRERFYAADAFSRFYRDNTLAEEIASLEDEMYYGVIEKHREPHADSLTRVNAVMGQAAAVHPGGPLARHARVQVKQGICHHFVNDKRLLSWKL